MGRIEQFTSRTDAELARAALVDAGIPAYVAGDDAGGLHPELPFGIGGTAVVVPDEHDEEARRLLQAEFGDAGVDEAELTAAALAAGERGDVGEHDAGGADLAGETPGATVGPVGPESAVGEPSPAPRRRTVQILAIAVVALLVVTYLLDRLTA